MHRTRVHELGPEQVGCRQAGLANNPDDCASFGTRRKRSFVNLRSDALFEVD
jgi:hypothetical protein